VVSELDLRLATEGDLDRLQFISAQARGRYRAIPALAVVADAPPLTTSRFEPCRVEVVVDRAKSDVVGFAAMRPLDGLLYLDNISVELGASGRGIGVMLLSSVVAYAIRLQVAAVSLTTFKEPIWNGPWFRKYAFQPMPCNMIGVGLREVMERQSHTVDPNIRETLWRLL
jgi:N-acetylglutamate synthase-like GNAT family acetyltransferase